MESPNDVGWSLIALAARGDRNAQSAFSRNYLPVIRGLLDTRWRATSLAGEIDDAVQEVFVECFRANGVLSRADAARGDLGGLLFGVTRNVAARFEERARKRLPLDRAAEDAGLDAIAAREPSLSTLFDREWARTMLRLAGDLMRTRAEAGGAGAKLRVELLRLRFAENLPMLEIAAQWEADPAMVHKAYAKARDEFRACLRRVVAEHAVRSEVDLDGEVARVLELLR